MTSVSSIAELDKTTGIPLVISLEEETAGSPVRERPKSEPFDFPFAKTQFPRELSPDQSSAVQIQKEKEGVTRSKLPLQMERFVQPREDLLVATHREELDGYVKKIVEDKAYIVFETPGALLERAVKLSKLEAIHADCQGALIRLVVEERGASMNIKFENLEEKGIATWRDKIKDEDLEKYDLLKKSALPRKPSKLQ